MAKIISYVLNSITRPLFCIFHRIQYELDLKSGKFVLESQNQSIFDSNLDQNGQNHLFQPSEPCLAFKDIGDDLGQSDPNLVQFWPKLTIFDNLHLNF